MLSKEEIVKELDNITDKYCEKISEIGEDDYNEDLDDICCDINELIEKIEDGIENDDYYRGYNERDKLAKEICKQCKYRNKARELGAREQKLIERLEEFGQQSKEENAFYKKYNKESRMYWINIGRMQLAERFLKILKGEKNEH